MVRTFDDLIEFLLSEVALCGAQGASSADFRRFIKSFYQEDSSSSVSIADLGHSFESKVWVWINNHEDVRVVFHQEQLDVSWQDFQSLEERASVSSDVADQETSLGAQPFTALSQAAPELPVLLQPPLQESLRQRLLQEEHISRYKRSEGTKPVQSLPKVPTNSSLATSHLTSTPVAESGKDSQLTDKSVHPRETHTSVGIGSEIEAQSLHEVDTVRRRGPRKIPKGIIVKEPIFDSPPDSNKLPRIYVSQNRTWQAVAGHPMDLKRLPSMLYELLSIIASHGPNGILQPELVRLSGQDKRSVPGRTDKLAEAGYIDKSPVQIHKTRTSLCVHKKFIGEGHFLKATGNMEDTFRDRTVILSSFVTLLYKRLQAEDLPMRSLRQELGIDKQQWGRRALRSAIQRLESTGLVQQVQLKKKDSPKEVVLALRLLRPPTDDDVRHLSVRRKGALRTQAESVVDDDDETDDLTKNVDLDIDYDDDDNTRRSAQWTPDRLISNMVFDVVHGADIHGCDSISLRDTITGRFWKRPLESYVSRLTDNWEQSQPTHLQHLAIIRDTTVTDEKRFIHYIYRTRDNFQKAVDARTLSWEAICDPEPQAICWSDMDKWGFQMLDRNNLDHGTGASSLKQCRAARQVLPRIGALGTDIETPQAVRKRGRPPAKVKTVPKNWTTSKQYQVNSDIPEDVQDSPTARPPTSHQKKKNKQLEIPLLSAKQRIALGLPPRGRLGVHIEEQIKAHRRNTGDPTSLPNVIERDNKSPARQRQATRMKGKKAQSEPDSTLFTRDFRIANGLPLKGRLAQITIDHYRGDEHDTTSCSECLRGRTFIPRESFDRSIRSDTESENSAVSPPSRPKRKADGIEQDGGNTPKRRRSDKSSLPIMNGQASEPENALVAQLEPLATIAVVHSQGEDPVGSVASSATTAHSPQISGSVTRTSNASKLKRAYASGKTPVKDDSDCYKHGCEASCTPRSAPGFYLMPETTRKVPRGRPKKARIAVFKLPRFPPSLATSTKSPSVEDHTASSRSQADSTSKPTSGAGADTEGDANPLQNACASSLVGPEQASRETASPNQTHKGISPQINRAESQRRASFGGSISQGQMPAVDVDSSERASQLERSSRAASPIKSMSAGLGYMPLTINSDPGHTPEPRATGESTIRDYFPETVTGRASNSSRAKPSIEEAGALETDAVVLDIPAPPWPSLSLQPGTGPVPAPRVARKKGAPLRGAGSVAFLRTSIVKELMERCNGVIPCNNEMTGPFFALWAQRAAKLRLRAPGPDIPQKWINEMVSIPENNLKKITYIMPAMCGNTEKKRSVVFWKSIEIDDPRIKEVQMGVIKAFPGKFYPEGIRDLVPEEELTPAKSPQPEEEKNAENDTDAARRFNERLRATELLHIDAASDQRQVRRSVQTNREDNSIVSTSRAGSVNDRRQQKRLDTLNTIFPSIGLPLARTKPAAAAALVDEDSDSSEDVPLTQLIVKTGKLSSPSQSHSSDEYPGPTLQPVLHAMTSAPSITTSSKERSRSIPATDASSAGGGSGQRARTSSGSRDRDSKMTLRHGRALLLPGVRFFPTSGTFSTDFDARGSKITAGHSETISSPEGLGGFVHERPTTNRKRVRFDMASESSRKKARCGQHNGPARELSDSSSSPTLLDRLTGLTGDLNEAIRIGPTRKNKDHRVRANYSVESYKLNRTTKDRAEAKPRRSIETPHTTDIFKKLFCSLVVASCMSAEEGKVDWTIVTKVHAVDPTFELAKAQKIWAWIRANMKAQLEHLTFDFESRFLEAYESGSVAAIEDVATYDWAFLIRWAMRACEYPEPPLYGAGNFLDNFDVDISSRENFDLKAWNLERLSHVNRAQRVLRYAYGAPVEEVPLMPPFRDLDRARSWIRANTATPQLHYDAVGAHDKFAQLATPALERAVVELSREGMIRMRKNKRLLPGRNFDFAARFALRYRKPFELPIFVAAVNFKKELDHVFAQLNVEDRIFHVARTANDGAVMALMSLVSDGRVKLIPRVPPTRNENGAAHPRISVWGFAEGQYFNRKIDRKHFFWPIDVIPTSTYQYGNPLSPSPDPIAGLSVPWKGLPEPPLPGKTNDTALLPIWSSIDGSRVTWPWWYRILNLVLQTLMFQPGISSKEMYRQLPVSTIEEFEVKLTLDWLVSANAARKLGHDAYTTLPGFWAAFGETLRDLEDDWFHQHVLRHKNKANQGPLMHNLLTASARVKAMLRGENTRSEEDEEDVGRDGGNVNKKNPTQVEGEGSQANDLGRDTHQEVPTYSNKKVGHSQSPSANHDMISPDAEANAEENYMDIDAEGEVDDEL